jgi:hypothetical protein
MSTSFKRVISHPDEVGQISKKMSTGLPWPEQEQQHAMMTTAASAETPPPAVVECDDNQQPEPSSSVMPFSVPRPLNQRSFSSSSSSLSDRSEDHDSTKDDDDDMMNETEGSLPIEIPLSRIDSGLSCDSSVRAGNRSPTGSGSGTWGWYPDEHVGNPDDLQGDTEDYGPSRLIDICQQDVNNGTYSKRML